MSPPIPVLIVAHQMPPVIGPGTRRPAAWVREWPAEGLGPIVLTAPPDDAARFHGYPIGEGARPPFEVVATPSPRGFAGLLAGIGAPHRVAWTLCHRSVREPETPWGRPAIERGISVSRERGVRAVVSTSQPYEAHVVGRAVARAAGVPWIADFRDPMTEAEGRTWPTRLHWWCERREERAIFQDASAIWATCESAAARWRTRFPFADRKIHVHRNGVGPIDVDALPKAPPVPPLRIGHIGRFTDSPRQSRLSFLESRPGGPSGAGSSPRPLLAAIELFVRRRPEAAGRVVWMTVGSRADAAPPAGVVVEPHPPTSNAEALARAASCHALYLPLTRPPNFGCQFVQQKVYEYAALRRPVLVTGTPREAVDLLGSLARLAREDDAETLSRHVEALWDAGAGAGSGSAPPPTLPSPPRESDVARATAREVLALIRATARGDTRREAGNRVPPA